MPENTKAQEKRRKDAIFSAGLHIFFNALTGVVLLLLRAHYGITGIWGAVMLVSAIVEFGMVIPILMILKERLKEIQGGEEDAAAQY